MDKNIEYTMLKQEIINTSDIIVNITLSMYAVTVTIFVFALEFDNCYAFLLSYLIFIPFQNMINRKRDGINRIAAYIAVYLENGEGWESNYNSNLTKIKGNDRRRRVFTRLFNFIIGQSSSTQLGLLSTILFYITYIPKIDMNTINIFNYFMLILPSILLAILFLLNQKILMNINSRNEYIIRLKKQKYNKKDENKIKRYHRKNIK